MPETSTALPIANEAYALGYTDYIVLTREGPDGQWVSAFTFPGESTTLDAAKGHLAYFLDLQQRSIAEATERVTKAKTDEKRAKRQRALDRDKRMEYRIFYRQVSPFAPYSD